MGRAGIVVLHRDLPDCVKIAEGAHRRAGWVSPPNPLRLAAASGVRVFKLPADVHLGRLASPDDAFYRWTENQRERGLRIAVALGRCLLLRSEVEPTPEAVQHLAAELLAPLWALEQSGDVLAFAAGHPWSPARIVGEQARLWRLGARQESFF